MHHVGFSLLLERVLQVLTAKWGSPETEDLDDGELFRPLVMDLSQSLSFLPYNNDQVHYLAYFRLLLKPSVQFYWMYRFTFVLPLHSKENQTILSMGVCVL